MRIAYEKPAKVSCRHRCRSPFCTYNIVHVHIHTHTLTHTRLDKNIQSYTRTHAQSVQIPVLVCVEIHKHYYYYYMRVWGRWRFACFRSRFEHFKSSQHVSRAVHIKYVHCLAHCALILLCVAHMDCDVLFALLDRQDIGALVHMIRIYRSTRRAYFVRRFPAVKLHYMSLIRAGLYPVFEM